MRYRFLKISKTPDANLLHLLDNNVIGTPGQGMRYQHKGVKNKIHQIANPYFVHLMRNDRMTGTCCFCERTTLNAGTAIKSFYIRYFSFRDIFRRKNPGSKSASGKSALRNEVKALLQGEGLTASAHEPFYHYAYVDPRNTRSAVLCEEFGFQPVRQFTTILFNRLHPREHKARHIELITSETQEEIKNLVDHFYRGYTMFSQENLFQTRAYYVIKNPQGEITAGAQAHPDHWKILSLPGTTGKIILNLFTPFPLLNRLFNKQYRFLTLEGIYYKPGCEKELELLFEHLLHRYQLYTALISVDANSDLYSALKSLQLGLVDKLSKEVRGNVIAKFIRFNEQQTALFKENPAYLSGIDVT